MLFDFLLLSSVSDELDKLIMGGRIEKVTQPTPFEVVLKIYNGALKPDILISCDPNYARIHQTWVRRENPPQPYSFCMLLRKYLDGARILSIERSALFGERILNIRCRSYDGAQYTLITEFMGKHSNIILINQPEIILGAAKHITSDINRFREVIPGIKYMPPPKQTSKLNPLLANYYEDQEDGQIHTDEAAGWLVSQYLGISPFLAQECVFRCKKRLSDATMLSKKELLHDLADILNVLQTKEYTPMVWSNDRGVTQGAYPIILQSVPLSNQYARDSIGIALDNAVTSILNRDTFETTREALLTAVNKARKQREADLVDIDKGLANVEKADEYQEAGDLLNACPPNSEKLNGIVEVQDYYNTNSDGTMPMRKIKIDPAISIHENAEKYYKKAAKARASKTLLMDRRLIILEEIKTLDQSLKSIDNAKNVDQLNGIHNNVAGILARHIRKSGLQESSDKETQKFEGHKIKSFHSVDGWEILIGENASANDYLTTKVAASSDIWLHVRAATSAHGVIRAQNRPASVSPAALRHAAELVAARSEVKHSSVIPVDYTLKKYVRKPRKSATGSVTYQNEKTLYVGGIHEKSGTEF